MSGALTDRIADLEEEVAFYRRELGVAENNSQVNAVAGLGLTQQEARLAVVLFQAKGRVLTREQLLEAISTGGSPSGVSTVLSVVRSVIGRAAIETVQGVGYRITPAGQKIIGDTILKANGIDPELASRINCQIAELSGLAAHLQGSDVTRAMLRRIGDQLPGARPQ